MSLPCILIIFAAGSRWLSRFFPAILSKADQTAVVVSGPTTSIAGLASPSEFAAVLTLL
jgi:hypothetical protein